MHIEARIQHLTKDQKKQRGAKKRSSGVKGGGDTHGEKIQASTGITRHANAKRMQKGVKGRCERSRRRPNPEKIKHHSNNQAKGTSVAGQLEIPTRIKGSDHIS